MNFFRHLNTINHHKFLVMKYCFRLGLYHQGLWHDMSKYSPVEFFAGVKYYAGTESPNNKQREATGMSTAWLHHKGRNKHHFEYWVDYSKNPKEGFVGMKMPVNYVAEMFCDRLAASKIYLGERYREDYPLAYYLKGRHRVIIHPETEALLLRLLTILQEEGEDAAFSYLKREVLKK